MKIAMIGTGYVGLVSGACFSDVGHDVVCVDKDARKIEALHAGQMPIYEPGLDVLVARNVEAGRLNFTTDLPSALDGVDAVFIAVGTPARKSDGHADLSYVYAVATELAGALDHECVIVTKSTVPVGTGDEVERLLADGGKGIVHHVASNPEFLREGAAIGDFMKPDRVVIGVESEKAEAVLQAIYKPLADEGAPILATRRRTAEMIKYAANAFLATKITFINEIADLCEAVNANVDDVARGIGMDDRIGKKFLQAGPGYGGSCFPKDTLALLKTGQDNQVPLRIVEATVEANDLRKRAMAGKIVEGLGGNVTGKRVALLGLTFKPNTDDMRDSPSIDIVGALQEAGAHVVAYDPEGMAIAAPMMPQVEMARDSWAAIDGADAVAVVTEWDAFRSLDLAQMAARMNGDFLADLRNIYNGDAAKAVGLRYISIGTSSR